MSKQVQKDNRNIFQKIIRILFYPLSVYLQRYYDRKYEEERKERKRRFICLKRSEEKANEDSD